jgi:hypothetical protein
LPSTGPASPVPRSHTEAATASAVRTPTPGILRNCTTADVCWADCRARRRRCREGRSPVKEPGRRRRSQVSVALLMNLPAWPCRSACPAIPDVPDPAQRDHCWRAPHPAVASAAPEHPPRQWITLAEAERISGINRGVISRAVDAGALASNGQKGRGKRKIDAGAFTRWQLQRAQRPERTERTAHVQRLVDKHVRD